MSGRWGTPKNFLLSFIDELWKTQKSDLWKNEKIYWRYRFPYVYRKPQSYEVQFLRYEVRQIFLFWVTFRPFNPLPLNNQENQKFQKMKKASRDSSF